MLVEVLFFLGLGSGRSVREGDGDGESESRFPRARGEMVAAGSLERPVKAGLGRGR